MQSWQHSYLFGARPTADQRAKLESQSVQLNNHLPCGMQRDSFPSVLARCASQPSCILALLVASFDRAYLRPHFYHALQMITQSPVNSGELDTSLLETLTLGMVS